MNVGRSAVSKVVRTAAQVIERPAELHREPTRYVAGEVIGDKYKLMDLLVEGGMGSLWIAKNVALDALVALKLVRTDVAAPGSEERFLTEARAAARLKHPSIVRVFDYGQTRHNEPYIIMELLQGETLGKVLDREQRLDATYAVQVLLPIADALSAAHVKGIVHRDLKPDNIFLADSDDGRVQPKILDFGIAKLLAEGTPQDHRITAAGTIIGSPDYMSPEQARGLEDIDHRADIWAFCVLLYASVVGRVPFADANYNALLRHIIEDDVPPTVSYGAGDEELWSILERGFQKDREHRYQNVREIGERLASWLIARGVTEDLCGHSLRASWLEPLPGGRTHSIPPPRVALPSQPWVAPKNERNPTPLAKLKGFAPLLVVFALIGAGFVAARTWLKPEPQGLDANMTAREQASRSVDVSALPVEKAAPLASERTTAKVAADPEQASEAHSEPAIQKTQRTPRPFVPPAPKKAPDKPKGAHADDLGF